MSTRADSIDTIFKKRFDRRKLEDVKPFVFKSCKGLSVLMRLDPCLKFGSAPSPTAKGSLSPDGPDGGRGEGCVAGMIFMLPGCREAA